MHSDYRSAGSLIKDVNVDDVLHGAGLELMMKAEELIYATKRLNEDQCGELGADLYLLARVIGSILVRHGTFLKSLRVKLPDDVGVVRVKNPYYEKESRPASSDEEAGVDGLDELFPF